jgi:hypothetical protein
VLAADSSSSAGQGGRVAAVVVVDVVVEVRAAGCMRLASGRL